MSNKMRPLGWFARRRKAPVCIVCYRQDQFYKAQWLRLKYTAIMLFYCIMAVHITHIIKFDPFPPASSGLRKHYKFVVVFYHSTIPS